MKHPAYHRLIEKFDKDGCCPVCACLEKDLDGFVHSILYESVCDRRLRAIIKKHKGFCEKHAWKLFSYGDMLAHAIFYADFLGDLIKTQQYKKSADCIFCEEQAKGEEIYISMFIENWKTETEFRESFLQNSFLCARHMSFLQKRCRDKKIVREIETLQVARGQDMLEKLKSIITKYDYKSSVSITDEEKKALEQAIAISAGGKNG